MKWLLPALLFLASSIQADTWWGGYGNYAKTATLRFTSNGVCTAVPFATNTETYTTTLALGLGLSRSNSFTSLDTNVCTVNAVGAVSFVGFGTGQVVANFPSTQFDPAFAVTQSVVFSAIPWVYATTATLTFTQAGTVAISGAATNWSTNVVADAYQILSIYTPASNTQVYASVLVQGSGVPRSVASWESLNTNVCLVDSSGAISHGGSPGTANIVVNFLTSPNNPAFSVTQAVTYSVTATPSATNIAYVPQAPSYTYNVAVGNTNDSDSMEIFRAFTNAFPTSRVLLVGTVTNHSVASSTWVPQVWTPLTNITSTSTVRYVTLCGDFPFMVDGKSVQRKYGNQTYRGSTSAFSVTQYGSAPLFTYITGFTTNDAIALIHRGTNAPASVASTLWYFDDKGVYSGRASTVSNILVSVGVPATNILWSSTRPEGFTTLPAKNLAAFYTWGNNGGVGAAWASNGVYTVSGTNESYFAQSIESWNWGSQRLPADTIANQRSMRHLLAPWALGGSGYSRSPVGCVGHVYEPYLGGIHRPDLLWGNLARGLWLVEASAASASGEMPVTIGVPGARLSQ